MSDVKWSELVQLLGVWLLGVGVAFEFFYNADTHLVVITIGSIIFAIGTKLKHYRE